MSDIAIRCEGLGKQYRIGERESYKALRDVITDSVASPFRRLRSAMSNGNGSSIRNPKSAIPNSFWALKDISFEIQRGEVVGVIGRNGAGKSTLLKILSRITAPTEGEVEIKGRVGSLLEVGTGFHPELTGRENIFLNGAILGMRKAEIDRKFDEIVAFAEVEKFIDTPVKRYSSGMYVRLAFAVAAHMETEILLVDEVLAVGDAQFQKKCFQKMRDVRQHGCTILIVSHNMAAIRQLCQRGITLDQGRMIELGEVNQVADGYEAMLNRQGAHARRIETISFVIEDVRVHSTSGPVIKTFDSVEIRVKVTAKTDILDPGLYVGFLTAESQRVAGLDFKDFNSAPAIRTGHQCEFGFLVENFPLLAGQYQLEIHVKDMAFHKFEFVSQTFPFQVIEVPIYGGRKIDSWFGHVGLKAQAKAFSRIQSEAGF